LDERLASGAVQAVLAPLEDCHEGQRRFVVLRLSLMFRCLLLPDPLDYFQEPAVIERYRYQEFQALGDSYLTLDPAADGVHVDDYRLYIDVPLGPLDADELEVEVHFSRGGIAAPQLYDAICNLQPIEIRLRPDGLSFELDAASLDPVSLIQYCEIVFTYNPGLQVDRVRIFNRNPAVPQNGPELHFAGELDLLGAGIPETLSACQTYYLPFWWRRESADDSLLDLRLYLVDANGVARLEDEALLDPAAIHRRFLTIPCEIPPGDYEFMLRVFDSGEAIRLADTADQTLASLGRVNVRPPGA
jgi:hypothetical protein